MQRRVNEGIPQDISHKRKIEREPLPAGSDCPACFTQVLNTVMLKQAQGIS